MVSPSPTANSSARGWPRAHSDIVYPKRVFLIFGKETRGLPEELLAERYDRCVRLPMRESLRSLNLSNSVAVAVYEVLRQRNYEGLEKSSPCNLADIYGKL